jgi:hypothetical protein
MLQRLDEARSAAFAEVRKKASGSMADQQHQWTPEELQGLAVLGLSITPHRGPVHGGWGYTWSRRDWAGPFTTPGAAIHAAFTEAQQALLFRSEYSWALFAQPGERWQFNAGGGWVHISEPGSAPKQE